MLKSVFISVSVVTLSACSVSSHSGNSDWCSAFIGSSKEAIKACLGVMRNSLTDHLPEDADTAGIDVFENGFEVGISHGRLVREGGDADNLRVYLVCGVDSYGVVEFGYFYTYDHWPPAEAIPNERITNGRYIEQFLGPAQHKSYSESESRPKATLVFSRSGNEFEFAECVNVPDDW